jgi:hypothetical protein
MRRLSVFNMVSLDDFFSDKSGDMSWAHREDAEWNATKSRAFGNGNVLLCYAPMA